MRGGPLKDDEYQFMNVQFRWGPSNCRGAEHSIDNIWLEIWIWYEKLLTMCEKYINIFHLI